MSYYQMVLSPATYSKFYEKLAKKYSKYDDATSISLSTFGDALNSDYDENKTVLREESKHYVVEALSYFKKDYNVMVDGGNAYTWSSVDHILGIPLDSSRYNAEYASVPFVGVVLHGYVEYAGSAFNMEGDLRYFNVEFNSNGCMYLGMGSYIGDLVRLLPGDGVNPFSYKINKGEGAWDITYRVPYEFIRRFFPTFEVYSGKHMRANCYKCADLSEPPHYMAWSPIVGTPFKFHRPECFGEMIFG